MQTPSILSGKHYYRDLLTIGIPIIIGQLGTIVLGFADTLMIGHHSTEELAAAGLVNNIFSLALLFYLGFSYSLTPVVGQLYGMGRRGEIGQKVKCSLAANMLVGLLLTAVLTVLYLNLHRIGQPDDLLPLIRPYFIVNLLSILPVGVFNTFKQFFDGMCKPKVAMWAMIAANCGNILFNWLLIYGVGPFPELGLLGAGISTAGSRLLMALILVGAFGLGRRCHTYRENFLESRITREGLLEMNRLGWPVGIQLGVETAAFSLSCIMVGWLGTQALAAHQVMMALSQLFYLILSGMASAMSVRASHFMGKGDLAAVRRNASDCLRLNLCFSAITSVVVIIFRHQIGPIFCDSQEVAHIVAMLIFILVVYQFGDGLQFTYANALRGIKCVKPMMYYALVAYFLICLPLGYVLGFVCRLGIYGIWCGFPVGLTIAGLLYYWRFDRELKTRG